MAVTLNEADPCGTAAALRQAYANLISGGTAQAVSFSGGPNGTQRSVTYTPGHPEKLAALVRDWEAKCAGKSRRFCLRSGGSF
jgi:hypothetical protein